MSLLRRDRMTKDERMVALLNRERLDRVPVWGSVLGFSAVNVGYSVADIYSNAQRTFEAMSWTSEEYGFQDIPVVFWAPSAGKANLPTSEYSQAPSATTFAVTTEEEAWNLKLPDVSRETGRPPMQCAEMVLREGGPFVNFILMTFNAAAGLCGMDQLCRWMIKRPEVVHRLLRFATDRTIERARFWVETYGPERLMPYTAEPTTSNQLISPKHFEEFAFPYIKESHEAVLDMGVKHILCHICGEQNLNLPFWAQIPMGDPGIVSFGHEVDLEVASKHFPNDVIMGNVEPAVIQSGPPERIYELAVSCIEKGRKHAGGFMLAPGCEMPPRAPSYNVWTMVKAVNDHGWYE